MLAPRMGDTFLDPPRKRGVPIGDPPCILGVPIGDAIGDSRLGDPIGDPRGDPAPDWGDLSPAGYGTYKTVTATYIRQSDTDKTFKGDPMGDSAADPDWGDMRSPSPAGYGTYATVTACGIGQIPDSQGHTYERVRHT